MSSTKHKPVVHNIFWLCSDFIQDEGWKKIMVECSVGNFPNGVKYDNGFISCSRKRLSFNTRVPEDAAQAAKLVVEIFRDRLKIKTSKEKKTINDAFEKQRQSGRIETWKQATTNGTKQALIGRFADRVASMYHLPPNKTNELALFLSVNISSKNIDPTDIMMENGTISKINGFYYDSGPRLTKKILIEKINAESWPMNFVPQPQLNVQKQLLDVISYHAEKKKRCDGNAGILPDPLIPSSDESVSSSRNHVVTDDGENDSAE